jgi:broad specificity polyphosphatase/5'/3'-nucleotidase SurE
VRALITNDDGVARPGLRTLAAAAVAAGLDAVVARPSWDTSGGSAPTTAVLNEIHPDPDRHDALARPWLRLLHGLVAACAAHAAEVAGSRR